MFSMHHSLSAESCHIQNFSFVGCISDGRDQGEYKRLVDGFVGQDKTKEMVIGFKRKKQLLCPSASLVGMWRW